MSKMRQNTNKQAFVWTKVYDTHLVRMKACDNSCAEIADFINHNVSLGNETDKHNIELISAHDVRDRYELLQKPHTDDAKSATTMVKHIIAPDATKVGREKLIAVTLPLVPLRA